MLFDFNFFKVVFLSLKIINGKQLRAFGLVFLVLSHPSKLLIRHYLHYLIIVDQKVRSKVVVIIVQVGGGRRRHVAGIGNWFWFWRFLDSFILAKMGQAKQ